MNDELIIDNFAGGGGASTGIEQALGRPIDVAINHDEDAIEMHRRNHPHTEHLCESVWNVDPLAVVQAHGMRRIGLAWFSPDCKHFSKAKGGKPVEKKIRGLAWVALKWVSRLHKLGLHPRVIMLENVEEFQTWGPLGSDNRPCPQGKGKTFQQFIGALERFGYTVAWKELVAADYGTPTTRKRLFIIARCDGQPIRWPRATHAPRQQASVVKLKPWRSAAECIDWSIPCPSIFGRQKPLAENTLRRVATGLRRYVLENPKPFIVRIGHTGHGGTKVYSVEAPLTTITSKAEHCLVAPTMVQTGYGERQGQAPRALDIESPLGTVVATGKHALVAAFMAKHYGGVTGHELDRPIGAITQVDHHSLVTAQLAADGKHRAEVRAFLVKYYGCGTGQQLLAPLDTITCRDRFGLVSVEGELQQIADIGLRMLQPRELATAQGFPTTYILTGTKTNQVAKIGNSVCPQVARALVRENYAASQRQGAVA